MGLSSFLLKILAKRAFVKNKEMQKNALADQDAVLKNILFQGCSSVFGKQFGVSKNTSYRHFSQVVPVSGYEDLQNYITQISRGEKNVLTSGKPMYFAITSGTTSGTKYIPLTKKMMGFQTQAIKELLLLYAYKTNSYSISNVGMMFIQGSPELQYLNKIPFAKLSGIAAKHVPFFLKRNRYPSMKTNCIKSWDKKIEAIVEETVNKDMRVIGGIPPWVITYFNALLEHTKKKSVKEVFPGLQLYIHGGTGFGSYKNTFLGLCGDINTLEVYPASEGFFAYQNELEDESLLLLTNHGVFYEFISLVDFQNQKFNRIPLEGVSLNVDYVMIVSTIAGLWAYNIGDTVCFVSKNPYKIIFSGRASQYCSAFGEHVIEKEVQTALKEALILFGGRVSEFIVCPKIEVAPLKSHHEWFIEFCEFPTSLVEFENKLNESMMSQNIYYRDLVFSGVISPLKIIFVEAGGFNSYMKSIGKFGGQNKCPHLSNDRVIANFLLKKHVK